MARYTRFAFLIALVALALPLTASADDPPPHNIPTPAYGDIEALKTEFDYPAVFPDDPSAIDFVWDISNWLMLFRASRLGMWFATSGTRNMWFIVIALAVVLVSFNWVVNRILEATGNPRDSGP